MGDTVGNSVMNVVLVEFGVADTGNGLGLVWVVASLVLLLVRFFFWATIPPIRAMSKAMINSIHPAINSTFHQNGTRRYHKQ